MEERARFVRLTLIMSGVCFAVVIATVALLYGAAFCHDEARPEDLAPFIHFTAWLGVVAEASPPHVATEEPDHAPPAPALSGGATRILLAEDSADNRLLVQAYLKNTPHQLDLAEDGQEAVDKFTAAAGAYDLVLMDMQMPSMDGYAATRAIRDWEADTGVAPTPIIALTAFALEAEAQKSLDAGCDAHLAKPIKKAVLLETIERHGG